MLDANRLNGKFIKINDEVYQIDKVQVMGSRVILDTRNVHAELEECRRTVQASLERRRKGAAESSPLQEEIAQS